MGWPFYTRIKTICFNDNSISASHTSCRAVVFTHCECCQSDVETHSGPERWQRAGPSAPPQRAPESLLSRCVSRPSGGGGTTLSLMVWSSGRCLRGACAGGCVSWPFHQQRVQHGLDVKENVTVIVQINRCYRIVWFNTWSRRKHKEKLYINVNYDPINWIGVVHKDTWL